MLAFAPPCRHIARHLFNNSVLVQGRVVPPSVLKFRNVGARVVLKYRNAGARLATNLPRNNDLNAEQEFRTTKWRIVDGVEQEACKSGIRRLRLVRLHTAGDRQRAAVSGAGVGSHSTVTCRTTDGAVRRGSNSCCTVLVTLLVRQQREERRRLPVRRAHQVGGYIRPKDNGFVALLAARG